MKKNKVVCISFALPGVHYDYISVMTNYGRCSCTTYMSPNMFFDQLKLGRFESDEFAGAYVVDKEKILLDNPGLAIRSPMLDCKLAPRAISRLFEKTVENGNIEDCRSMDSVGIELFVEWWRNHGAKIGKIQDDGQTVMWE